MNKYSIIGPPGAGKSTQATLLAKAYGLVRISVGNLFR
jgi:adenylate kinase family enzyme